MKTASDDQQGRRHLLKSLAAIGLADHLSTPAAAGTTDTPSLPVSVSRWGVVGNNDLGDTPRIQRALDEAPIGCDLTFPSGSYRITAQLNVRRRLNLVGQGANLFADFKGDLDSDLLAINIEDLGSRDNRIQRIEGFNMGFSSGGRNCIGVYNRLPNVSNTGFMIRNNMLGVRSESKGYAIYLDGAAILFTTIRDCQIENGVYLHCADGTTIENCVIFGLKPAVTVDVVGGAFQTHIVRNGLVSRDGALHILRGSQVQLEHNQIEQFPSYGANQSAYGASVTITPKEYGSRQIRIVGNNFGGGSNARANIHVEGDCQDLFIDHNVFNVTASEMDIRLADAAVAWTRIGPHNGLRGKRIVNGSRLVVDDNGTGTYGVRLGISSIGDLLNGWRATTDFRFWKTFSGSVQFSGALHIGKSLPGTVIGYLPLGFRPGTTVYFNCPCDSPIAIATFQIDADGTIRVYRVSGTTAFISGGGFDGVERTAYPDSDL